MSAELDELRALHARLAELVNDPADEMTASGMRDLQRSRDEVWSRIEELEQWEADDEVSP